MKLFQKLIELETWTIVVPLAGQSFSLRLARRVLIRLMK